MEKRSKHTEHTGLRVKVPAYPLIGLAALAATACGGDVGQTEHEDREASLDRTLAMAPEEDGNMWGADSGRREDPRPPAGAPHYLHFGRSGVCTDVGAWHLLPEQGGMSFDEESGVLTIGTGVAWRALLRVDVDTRGTSNYWDDTLEVTLELYYKEQYDSYAPVQVFHESFNYYAPSSGGLDGFTTTGEPQNLFVRKIQFRAGGDSDDLAGVDNRSRVPMGAAGHFGRPYDGAANGFLGGSGPDCVTGSNYADRILTRGGDDFVRGRYGEDAIDGGDGNDTIIGGGDDDVLRGGSGADEITGGDNDCFLGGQDGMRDVLIMGYASWTDFPVFQKEPGVLNGVPVDNIEWTLGFDEFSGVDSCM